MEAEDDFFDLIATTLAYWHTVIDQFDAINYDQLDAEKDNLREAIAFGLQHPTQAQCAIDLLIALFQFAKRRCHWYEWLALILNALQHNNLSATIQIKLNNQAGILYRLLHQYERAIEHHWEAGNLLSEQDEEQEMMHVYANLSNVYYQASQYQQAMVHSQQAYQLMQKAQSVPLQYQAAINNGLGLVYMATEDYLQSIPYFIQAGKLCQQLDALTDYATIANNLALVYFAIGQSENSFAVLDEALTLLEGNANERERARTYLNKGTILAEIGNLHKAEESFRQANSAFLRDSSDLKHKAMVSHNLAHVLRQQNRPQEAIVHLQSALQQWRNVGNLIELSNSLTELAKCLTQINHTTSALQTLDEAKQILTQIPRNARSLQIVSEIEQQCNKIKEMPSEFELHSARERLTAAINNASRLA